MSKQKKKLEKIGMSKQLNIILADRDKQQEDSLYDWIKKELTTFPR